MNMEQIEREIFVTKKEIQDMIQVVEGTSMIPIVLHVMDFTIPAGSTAVAYIKRMDGSKEPQLCTILDNTIIFTPQSGFFRSGISYLQIRVVSANANLFSFAIEVQCQKNMTLDDSEITEDKTLLEQILSQLGELSIKVSNIVEMTNEEMDIIFDGGSTGGGEGGEGGVSTSDYNDLENKPSINGVTLQGALDNDDLGVYGKEDDMTGSDLDEMFNAAFS